MTTTTALAVRPKEETAMVVFTSAQRARGIKAMKDAMEAATGLGVALHEAVAAFEDATASFSGFTRVVVELVEKWMGSPRGRAFLRAAEKRMKNAERYEKRMARVRKCKKLHVEHYGARPAAECGNVRTTATAERVGTATPAPTARGTASWLPKRADEQTPAPTPTCSSGEASSSVSRVATAEGPPTPTTRTTGIRGVSCGSARRTTGRSIDVRRERYLSHIAKTKAKPLASAKKVLETANALTSLPVPEPSPIQIVQPHELHRAIDKIAFGVKP